MGSLDWKEIGNSLSFRSLFPRLFPTPHPFFWPPGVCRKGLRRRASILVACSTEANERAAGFRTSQPICLPETEHGIYRLWWRHVRKGRPPPPKATSTFWTCRCVPSDRADCFVLFCGMCRYGYVYRRRRVAVHRCPRGADNLRYKLLSGSSCLASSHSVRGVMDQAVASVPGCTHGSVRRLALGAP